MSLKINFYLESREGNKKNLPINMIIWFDKSRLKYYTGYRIDVGKWDKKDQEVKKNNLNEDGLTASFINQKLSSLKNEAAKIYNHHDVLKKELNVNIFRNELKAADPMQIKKANEKAVIDDEGINYFFEKYKTLINVSPGLFKHVCTTIKHFNTFLESDRNIKDITHETLTLFENHLRASENKGHNTVVSNMKRLRTFFKYAEMKEWIVISPFNKYKLKGETYGLPIALTKDELELLYAKDLSSIPIYDQIRDIFVFQCCIGCRVSDLMRLTHANIINGFIQYVPKKTKEESPRPVKIPLNDKAKNILQKYSESDKLLPVFSDVKYNLFLKDLFKYCKITRQVMRLNPLTQIEESVSLAEIASSHLARRTFISILHKKVKDSVIASMTGHSKDSKAFSRYYDIEDEQKSEIINLI